MIYGYARVSTATQGRDGNSLEDQVAALEKYGCQKIVQEAFTGKTMDRPKFMSLQFCISHYTRIIHITPVTEKSPNLTVEASLF